MHLIYRYCLIYFYSISAEYYKYLGLNAWLGGYQSILKCMTPGNFNWFLHTMLFYHTKYVIQKQQKKQPNVDVDEEENLGLDEEAQDNEEDKEVEDDEEDEEDEDDEED